MVELSLMAASAFSPGFFHQEQQGLCRVASSKEFQALIPGHGTRRDMPRSGCLQLRPTQLGDPWVSIGLLSEFDQSSRPVSAFGKPVLTDVKDAHPESELFSFGIAEQCKRHEKILQFLMSGSSTSEEGLNISLLSDLMGLHTLAINMPLQPHAPMDDELCLYKIGNNDSRAPFIYPRKEFYSPKPLLDFFGDLSHGSTITVHPDGRLLFTGTGAEIKDLLSIVSEFYLPKNSTIGSKKPMLVPYFTRSGSKARADNQGSSLKLQTETVTPLKSPGKMKLKPSLKKKQNRQAGRERDLYRKNYFHACESLLSMILHKSKGQIVILSLKKSGPELPQLLTEFSAGIAGTGLAVLFSVIWKVTNGRVPFSTGKLLNTGLGFGLVWLSWSVNALRDTIVHISRNSSRLRLKEEDIVCKVEKSVNEFLFRAAALMAVVALRLV